MNFLAGVPDDVLAVLVNESEVTIVFGSLPLATEVIDTVFL